MKQAILFSLLLLLLVPAKTMAQKQGQALIDSLQPVIAKAPDDTAKANLLYELAFSYYTIDPDEGIKASTRMMELVRKLDWEKGIAKAHNVFGLCFWNKSDYANALEHFFKAKEINQRIGNLHGLARNLGNIGLIYDEQSDYPKALDYNLQALKINEAIKDEKGIALNNGNIGVIYKEQLKYDKALEYYTKALDICRKNNDKHGIMMNTGNIGEVYKLTGKYDKALEYIQRSLDINRELKNTVDAAIDLGNIGSVYRLQGNYKKALECYEQSVAINFEADALYEASEDLNNIGLVYFSIARDMTGSVTHELKDQATVRAKMYTDSAIALLTRINGDRNYLQQFYLQQSEISSFRGDFKAALGSYMKYAALKDSVFNESNTEKMVQAKMNFEFEKKDAITQAQIKRQRIIRNAIAVGLAGLLIFFVLIYRQRNRIKKEKKRSEDLLLNILPAEVAEELKEKGYAEAKHFESVTVLFTDFKNFTNESERATAQELVNEINYCYSAFDEIISRYRIEKIKTIGDSYMCAGGLPVVNKTNAVDVVSAALEIRDFMIAEKKKRAAEGRSFFEIRIGCHTGPVVAGIVGIKKYAYDIWGDTVNTASRMESGGEPGKVNISAASFELVKDKFNCTYRGKIQAKNKGEIDMYFAEQL